MFSEMTCKGCMGAMSGWWLEDSGMVWARRDKDTGKQSSGNAEEETTEGWGRSKSNRTVDSWARGASSGG